MQIPLNARLATIDVLLQTTIPGGTPLRIAA